MPCFDPQLIPLITLVKIHLRTHSSTSAHKLRGKYRSTVYVIEEEMETAAKQALTALVPGFDAPLVTKVLSLHGFRASPEGYRSYAEKNADIPGCLWAIALPAGC